MSLGTYPGSIDSTSNFGSGGNLEAQLTPWFGTPNQFAPLNIDGEGKNPHVTHNLPLAFYGKSKDMEQLIEFRVVNNNEWYTSELMPWKQSDDINLQWMVLDFKKSYFEIEPYQGVPSYIQSSVEGYSDKLIQRGMAFIIAHGFWKTEMGRQQYRMNFEVLESSARLTVYHLIIMAILKAKNIYRNFELKFKTPATTIPEALKRLKMRFGVLNKGMADFRTLLAQIIQTMRLNGANPNLLALPPSAKILMSLGHDSETEFNSAGELAVKNRTQGPSTQENILGLNVRETTVFNEVMFGTMYNPLRRIRETGTFHWITNYYGSANLESYTNESRFAAKIMDASKGGQDTLVSGRELFKLSARFDGDGSLSGYHHEPIKENKLAEMRRRLGDTGGSDKTYIDMFIGYDPSRDPAHPYYVMEYLGEQWEMDVSQQNIRDFALTAKNQLSKCLSQEEMMAMCDADEFMDSLNKSPLDSDYKYYWMAVALSGTIPGGENYSGEPIFKNNGYGSINPPIISNGRLSIKVSGTVENLVFSRKNANSDLGIFLRSEFEKLANGANGANDIGSNEGDAGNLRKALEDDNQAAKALQAGAELFYVKTPFEPVGFGTPSGLRTLSRMYTNKDYRGYSIETLQRAHMHYNLLVKVFEIWRKIFPGHELGEERAAPFYFRGAISKDNQLTAFGLNLYNHARYPVFALIPGLLVAAGGGALTQYTFGRSPDNAVVGGIEKDLPVDMLNALKTGARNVGVDEVTVERRAKRIPFVTQSPEVKNTISQLNIKDRLQKNYRNKPFKSNNKDLPLFDFLALTLFNSTADQTQDERSIDVFSAAFEILLRDNLNTEINWESEIKKALDTVIQIKGVTGKTPSALPQRQPAAVERHRQAINTRVVLDPEEFRRIAQAAEVAVDNTAANKLLRDIAIRPMNIFNPNQALGVSGTYTAIGGATTPTGRIDTAQNVAPDQSKKIIAELKFAQAPIGRNTVSSLTTSGVFSSHLSSDGTQRSSSKRLFPEDTVSDSSVLKKRMIGGVLARPAMQYSGDSNRLLSAIPQAENTYGVPESFVQVGEPSIPMNIALDAAYKVFTFDGHHQDIAGAQTSHKAYRTRLVQRFHDWAQETDPALRIFAQSYLTSRIRLQTFEAFWNNDCIPLVAFQLFRPRQRYYMGSGFVAEGGDRLGNAYHGFHDFQWSDDIIHKVHVGHYTFNAACPVKDPKLVAMIEDAVMMGYIGGEDVSFCEGPDDFHTLVTDPSNAPGSILVKMIPYNRGMPTSPQDIGGRWNSAIYQQLNSDAINGDNLIHGESVYYYNSIYDLDRLNSGLMLREPIFHNPAVVVNTTVFRGQHIICNPKTGVWDVKILDDGLTGDPYPGCIMDRDIVGRSLKKIDHSHSEVYS